MPDTNNRFDVQPTASNHFAWIRTQMGLQRTLMAGIRTSVSLIGFGFTVAKFFEGLSGQDGRRLEAPRDVGLILIGAGVVALLIFLWQFHEANRYLRGETYAAIAALPKRRLHTATYFSAIVVVLVGILAFGMVWFRF
ncbi:MAG TPA: DUF202 domain-containing protein [Hyphomonadaceae bacterium]|nr:DUF202 domain-containing protein [Hyphomonadaceae bacterium]